MAIGRIVGYSTVDAQPGSTGTSLYDEDIALRDLLNAFQTPKGSRVMLPTFGSSIYSYLFEPLTDATKEQIANDAKDVVGSDSRFQLVNTEMDETEHGITLNLSLIYHPTGSPTTLAVNFHKKNQEES